MEVWAETEVKIHMDFSINILNVLDKIDTFKHFHLLGKKKTPESRTYFMNRGMILTMFILEELESNASTVLFSNCL